MAIKIYGVAVSTCTKRVITTLLEKEVPYELITIDWSKAEHKQPEHLRKHPFGKVPVLEDDGYFVFESRAICKYIAKKFAGQGTKLIPDSQDDRGYGLFEQASLALSYHTLGIRLTVVANRRAPLRRATSILQRRASLTKRHSKRTSSSCKMLRLLLT